MDLLGAPLSSLSVVMLHWTGSTLYLRVLKLQASREPQLRGAPTASSGVTAPVQSEAETCSSCSRRALPHAPADRPA